MILSLGPASEKQPVVQRARAPRSVQLAVAGNQMDTERPGSSKPRRRVLAAAEDAGFQQNPWTDSEADERTLHLLSQAARLAKDGEAIWKGLAQGGEATAEQDKTPQVLLAAARVGDRVAVKQQIARGTNLDLSNELFRETALCTAAAHGHRAVANLLLQAAAQVDMADRAGWTPLMWAASYGHPAVLRLLLESGASSIARGGGGRTALELAQATNKVDCVLALRAWSVGSLYEHRAASRIQARQRGRSARRRRKVQEDAATRIQSRQRGKAGRCSARARHQARLAEERARLAEERARLGSEEEHTAATKLQAWQRGRAVRQRMAAEQAEHRAQRRAKQSERVAAARRAARRAERRAAQSRLHFREATEAEHGAATRLQAVQRGRLARKQMAREKRRMAREADEHRAATKLQALQRGRLTRVRMAEERRAATKIQARQRGRQGRYAFARRPDVLLREMTVLAGRLDDMTDEFSVRCWGIAPLGQRGL